MKKPLVISVLAAAIIVAGGVAWYFATSQTTKTQSSSNSSSSSSDASSDDVQVDEGQNEIVEVTMQNTSFSPKRITIKKGTTVKWINADAIRHNVVASNANNTGGLPTENPLFGKGGTYSFTFETVGTFDYRCTPHPGMTGVVEVTE